MGVSLCSRLDFGDGVSGVPLLRLDDRFDLSEALSWVLCDGDEDDCGGLVFSASSPSTSSTVTNWSMLNWSRSKELASPGMTSDVNSSSA